MISTIPRPQVSALAFVAAILASCTKQSPPATGPLVGTIKVDGSSTVLPLSQEIANAFHELNPGVQVTVGVSGSGSGFKKLCAGLIDIADASRPINAAESSECKRGRIDYVELPIGFDAISVVVSAKNTFVDCLTVGDLKTIWQPAAEGTIKTWNQIRPTFPANPLVLFGPGRESGTFDYFTLAIVGTESSGRNDYTQSEDDTVIERGVAADPNALGYFGYAYYVANKEQLKLIGVDCGHGCVLPSARTVTDGTYQPLLRPLFIYVNAATVARPEVKAFTRFYLAAENAQYVTKVGYVPLPPAAVAARSSRFEKGIAGSALGGHGSVTGVKVNAFDDDDDEKVKSLLVQ
jgi:phosphate transport system substrate-binding protein